MLYQIQYLRGVAVLAVVYFHLLEVLNGNGFALGNLLHGVGPVGVDIFFVLSGFIMARIADRQKVKPLTFFTARIRRVAPIYWVATLVVFSIAYYFPHLLDTTQANWIQLAHSLLFIPNGMSDISSSPILTVGWTLNYEMFFYLLIAFAAGILGDKKLWTVLITLIGLSLAGILVQPENKYAIFYTDPIIAEFGYGIIAYKIWARNLMPNNRTLHLFVIVLSSFAIIISQPWYLTDLRPIIWGIPAMLIVISAMFFQPSEHSSLVRVGNWSYGIYVWHVFLIVACVKTLVFLLS